jgi:chitinase
MSRIWLLVFCTLCISPAFAVSAASPVIVGYVFPQNAALTPAQVDPHRVTRVNYAFANLTGGKIVTGFASDPQNFATLLSLKQRNPNLTVLVSVGGWSWSTNFSDMALTKQSRSVFIQSVVDFLKLYKLDGLDIDWEYPGMVGAGNHFRSVDKQNYTLLLKELRARFTQEGDSLHRHLLLTIATGSSDEFLDHTEMGEVQKYVDTVNLMAYDYYEPGSDKKTGHHAPLFTNPSDPKKISADESVRLYEKAGVPAEKIVLGVPFYGHVWGGVPDRNHGLFQPGKPIPDGYAQYSAITSTMLGKGYTRYWDPIASAPYLYNAANRNFVSYEDSESLQAKCKYILEHRLGGVMFWDYTGDPSGKLLDTIDASFHKGAARGSN